MTATVIRTEGLTKRYGTVDALSNLDLEVAAGEVRVPRAQRLREDHHHPTAARPHPPDRWPLRDLRARQSARGRRAHRRLSYVPGEADLWPSSTGEESLHLLARVQGALDAHYRDELIDRFDLDITKKVRAYSKGNRQKLILVAGLMGRAELLVLDEPTSGSTP